MNLTKSERPHISFFGCTNSGKSSLVNAVTNQNLAVVSDVKGTTTDPVEKAMEILPLGPVVIIDTAGVNDGANDGVNDNDQLGKLRVEKTKRILDKTDIAVLVVDSTVGVQKEDEDLIKEFKIRKIPYIVVFNKSDLTQDHPPLEGGSKSLISGWGKNASHKYNQTTLDNPKELRNNATKQEKFLWQYLNKSQLGFKFRRQQPIGNYIADFFCPSLNLIIELDGGQHNKKQNIEYDKRRTEFFNKQGYKVLRIWNNDIDNNIEGVVEYIKSNLTPPPNPLPQGEGEQLDCKTATTHDLHHGEEGIYPPNKRGLNQIPDEIQKYPPLEGGVNITPTLAQDYPPLEGGSKSLISGWGTCKVSAKTGEGVNELKEKLGHIINENKQEKYIIRDRLMQGDIVILVIPIDESAPKGRVILPQQNVLRECLDAHATVVCCQVNELGQILKTITPKYVITDSQAFNEVKNIVPTSIILTSFSILMANYKGSLQTLLNGAETISKLEDNDKVLISEGCTHHRQCNDIGTVKFPKWIREYTGKNVEFEFTQGGEFPQDLSKYKLIIHCGGCMLNEAEMKNRIKRAKEQGVNGIPIVNYGMAIAYMNGILDRALEIFHE